MAEHKHKWSRWYLTSDDLVVAYCEHPGCEATYYRREQ
jgi:hypothetical protein